MIRVSLSLVNFVLRLVEKRYLKRAHDVVESRKRLSRQAGRLFVNPPFSCYLPDEFQADGRSVPVEWVSCGQVEPRAVILYFHGGAFVMGGPDTHRAMLAKLSKRTGLRAVLPDYRLAPENPFPAAIEDAVAAYRSLLAKGYPAEQIVLGGDSAGGGLVLALLHEICSADLPRPRAVFAFSPWVDMTLSGDSIKTNAKRDTLLSAERAPDLRDMYLQGSDPLDPRAPPLFGKFDRAPPVFIQASDSEILLDDSVRMVEVLKQQDVDASVSIWPSVPHVWQIFQSRLRQADEALEEVVEFIGRHPAGKTD